MELDYTKIFNIHPNDKSPKTGRILISEPFLGGDIFRRSIVLITSYSQNEGTLGFILNKPIKDQKIISRMQKELDIENDNIQIFIGGPVATEQLFYIHKFSPSQLPNSIKIKSEIFWGGNFDVLISNIKNGIFSADDVKFFIGYSGWAPGQLEDEIKERNAWLVEDITDEEIMTKDAENIWNIKINQLEKQYRLWSIVPEYPIMN